MILLKSDGAVVNVKRIVLKFYQFFIETHLIFQIDLFTVPDAILVGGNVTKITEDA